MYVYQYYTMINVDDGGEGYDVLSAGGREYNKTFVANAYIKKKNIISFLCSICIPLEVTIMCICVPIRRAVPQ